MQWRLKINAKCNFGKAVREAGSKAVDGDTAGTIKGGRASKRTREVVVLLRDAGLSGAQHAAPHGKVHEPGAERHQQRHDAHPLVRVVWRDGAGREECRLRGQAQMFDYSGQAFAGAATRAHSDSCVRAPQPHRCVQALPRLHLPPHCRRPVAKQRRARIAAGQEAVRRMCRTCEVSAAPV